MADQRLGGRRAAFRTCAPATAMTCMPSSPATMSRCAASRFRMRKKLSGHSDADVGAARADRRAARHLRRRRHRHAFPAIRSAMEGRGFAHLRRARGAARAFEHGGRIANADITLICEAPRIGPHREAMVDGDRGDARHFGRPHLDQGDDQREARLHRPRGRHRGDRDGERRLSRRGSGMSDTGETLRDRFLKACARRKILVATAESCTGGMIISLLTDIPGSSSMVDRGFVTYSNEAKMEMIGVSPDNARRAWRGVARDGAGDGGRRAGPFAGRHRAGRHRHCRTGRRLGRKAGRAGLVRTGRWPASRWSPRSGMFENRGRDFIRRETVQARAGRWGWPRWRPAQAPRRSSIDRVGALLEGVGEHAEGAVEHRAHQRAEDAALELVVDEEMHDRAAALRRLEAPALLR